MLLRAVLARSYASCQREGPSAQLLYSLKIFRSKCLDHRSGDASGAAVVLSCLRRRLCLSAGGIIDTRCENVLSCITCLLQGGFYHCMLRLMGSDGCGQTSIGLTWIAV